MTTIPDEVYQALGQIESVDFVEDDPHYGSEFGARFDTGESMIYIGWGEDDGVAFAAPDDINKEAYTAATVIYLELIEWYEPFDRLKSNPFWPSRNV